MTFEELWNKVNMIGMLPDTAIHQIPGILSNDVKRKLSRKTPEEVVIILEEVIEEINNGSIQSVDTLVKKHL